MKRTLVIIDMQRGFGNANSHITITAVIKQIERAKKFGDAIFVVEYLPYTNYQYTQPKIMAAIGNYAHIKVHKYDDSGSKEILEACDSHGSIPDIFRLCGVNTNACVQATLKGLYKASHRYEPLYSLEIVPEACNSNDIDTIGLFKRLCSNYNTKCIGLIPSVGNEDD